KRALFRRIMVFLLASIVGFGWAYQQAYSRLAFTLKPEFWRQVLTVQGTVTGISQWHEQTLRFDLNLNSINGEAIKQTPKLRLFWPKASQLLRDEDQVEMIVKLEPPWHLANPGGYDQQKQFFVEGIRAKGKVIQLKAITPCHQGSITRLREMLNEKMASLLVGKPLLGVIQATTLGLYKNITPHQWKVFQATGTTHAIAISGLHISLVAILFGGAITLLVKRTPFLLLYYPAKFYGAVAAMISAAIYCALAGFSIPTQRSLAMILMALVALLNRQKIASWHLLATAWLAIGFLDPLATLQLGFWLSFGCVAALIYGGSHASPNLWRKYVMPQIIVFIGLLPLGVLFFQQASLLSPLANFVALPIINFLVIPPSLLAILLMEISMPLAAISLKIAHGALYVVWLVLEKMADCPMAVWQAGHVALFSCFLAFLGVLLLLTPRGFPGRHFGWFGLLPMICYQPPPIPEGEFRLTVLDVGQGLSCVIQTREHALLYDAGGRYGKEIDAGQRVIKPYLQAQRIKKIDRIIISHGDLDHRAGLSSVQDLLHGEIFSSEPHRLPLPSELCEAITEWEWDGVRFRMLNQANANAKNRNDRSCVLKVMTRKQSVLLTGDIEKGAEAHLVQTVPDLLTSSIIVVPHHGSLTSSSPEFVKQVDAQYAIYPVGLGNHYGFPKMDVLKRYREQGAQNIVVAESGALIFQLNNEDELTPPTRWRDTSLKYWHTIIRSGE
ncbi:MAG: DNA internalization-related competence protein ComEC/Rec2, partial [Candidatus Berkiella sp.]